MARLTASERIRLKRQVAEARREQLRVDRILARRSFHDTARMMRENTGTL